MGRNESVIEEFRANGGRFEGTPLLLLTTTGRHSGRPHTTPVTYLRDGDRYLVFASNAGADTDPQWYRNLVAGPQVTIELGTLPQAARAVPLQGEQRDSAWRRQCAAVPAFGEYEARTDRVIPVVALHPLDLPEDGERARAIVAQLSVLHRGLREELAQVRAQIGTARETGLLDQLRRHCLTYCHGLQTHHTREDGSFTAFEARYPALAPAIARLRAEHRVVERALADLETFLARDDTDADTIAAELDRAVTGLEDHFAYEEEQLRAAVGF